MTLQSCKWAQMKACVQLKTWVGSNFQLEATFSKENSAEVGKKFLIWTPNLANRINSEKNLINKKVLTGN